MDYIHYFPVGKAKRHSICLGGELGFISSFGQTFLYDNSNGDREEVGLGGAIAVVKLGMDHPVYKRMHLNWGVRLGVLTAGVGLGISF